MNKLLVALALITVEFGAATILAMALATAATLLAGHFDTGVKSSVVIPAYAE